MITIQLAQAIMVNGRRVGDLSLRPGGLPLPTGGDGVIDSRTVQAVIASRCGLPIGAIDQLAPFDLALVLFVASIETVASAAMPAELLPPSQSKRRDRR